MSLKKALAAARAVDAPELPPLPDEGVLMGCVTLWELLTVTRVDGKPRQTCTISMWVQDGTISLCLNERDEGMALFSTGESLERAIEMLEERLQSDQPGWRKQRAKGKK